jgi:hypothetical protein
MIRAYGTLLLLLLSNWPTLGQGGQHLFLVSHNGRIGFIDSTGNYVIKPQFKAANEFSEGLAAIRKGAYYGFIDEIGDFVIEPQFEYATYFHEGLALVYNDGKPFFIDRTGKKAFENYFPYVGAFHNGRAKVSNGHHEGYMDKSGMLVIDTAYSRIDTFVGNYAIIHCSQPYTSRGDGLVDKSGRIIVPVGKYEHLFFLSNGNICGMTMLRDADGRLKMGRRYTCLDTLGKQIFAIGDSEQCLQMGDFSCGLARVVLRTKSEDGDHYGGKSYIEFINTKGELVFSMADYSQATDFSHNRAFAGDKNGHFSMINTQGTIIGDKVYTGYPRACPRHGFALVCLDNKWGMIDTNGQFILPPRYDNIWGWAPNGNYFFFQEEAGERWGHPLHLIGAAATDGTVLIPPLMDYVDWRALKHGLLKCHINAGDAYVNMKGTIVWQEDSIQSKNLEDMDIDYLDRAEFCAKTQMNAKHERIWVTLASTSQKISANMGFPVGQLSVNVRPEERDTFRNLYNGMRVYAANTTNKKAFFEAEQSCLPMTLQALDQNGKWRDIQYVYGSGCGNAQYAEWLDTNEYWTFVAPVYQGGFKTKLRIGLAYLPKYQPNENSGGHSLPFFEESETIYSNIFDGSVNPSQFWHTSGNYDPRGLDPYRYAR